MRKKSVAASTPPRTPVSTSNITAGAGVLRPGTAAVRGVDYVGNLFKADRPGDAAVRPEDLVAFRIERRNLTIVPGAPPRLVKSGTGAAYLILHFPPQALTEETFFEKAPDGFKDPEDDPQTANPSKTHPPKKQPSSDSSRLLPRPVCARIAGESRLVFSVPNGFDVPYTLAGVLDACRTLAQRVTTNARPPQPTAPVLSTSGSFAAEELAQLTTMQRSALASFAARNLLIAVREHDDATLRVRQFSGGPALRAVVGEAVAAGNTDLSLQQKPPRPVAPTAIQTAIELPWHLIVSPYAAERWQHAPLPVTSPVTGRTELWHSRLVAPDGSGRIIEPPHPDPRRTIRAVWALTRENPTVPMQSAWPNPSTQLPDPDAVPFLAPLTDFDRFQFAHLSSNFSVSGYEPQPIATNLLMLSSLGGWLDSQGAWDPPGLSVEEWVHRAAMARDHYVRVVYRGFLFPLGHRVALVKVSERKFHNGAWDNETGTSTIEAVAGNTAYLRQRVFIVVRERERRFDEPGFDKLRDNGNTRRYVRELPFSRIRLLTQVTPNLDPPDTGASKIDGWGQRMFWPSVHGEPFRFQCVGTDLDGQQVAFAMPMIFMDNTVACPRKHDDVTDKLDPDFPAAESNAIAAQKAYREAGDRRVVPLKQQRVALALSMKAGDTTVEADNVTFDAATESGNHSLRDASKDLSRPIFFPVIAEAQVRIAALAHLTGSGGTNRVKWNAHYSRHGFAANKGEVFVDIEPDPGMGSLDFSAQGDRSGGFVQPNLKPTALSRFAGPFMGDVDKFVASGVVPGGGGFPKTGDVAISDLPLPLLFGCIPLGDLIAAVTDVTGSPERIPKFGSEAGTQLEAFINGMGRLYGFVAQLAAQPASVAGGALTSFNATLQDLLQQAQAYGAVQIAPLQAAVNQLMSELGQVANHVKAIDNTIDHPTIPPALSALPPAAASARTHVAQLVTAASTPVAGVSLPAGLRQSVLTCAQKLDRVLADLEQLPALVAQGQALYNALDAIVGQPAEIGALFSDPAQLATRVDAVAVAIAPLRTTLAQYELLAGAPRNVVLEAMTAVEQVLAGTEALLELVEMLTGDELTIRFDWNPQIDSWWLPGVANPATDDPIFRANDKRGFLVAVEAKVKKNGSSAPKISVTCSLKHFDLVLIAPASFLELNFEKIEFSVDTAAKMDVDVLLSDIKFVGPLSFVETLRDLIPLDGFSDPPFLDISPQGIDAGFTIGLPAITCGVMSLSNLSLGAGFTVPFIGQPLSVRFLFCTREQPFCLTVWIFGGGGFFGVTVDPHGVQVLEAAFEFGAAISIDFGVASGGVHVMAGIYFRMEVDAASLTGYFRLGGHVDVLGLITASLELYLELRYEFESGKCVGKAQLTIEVQVLVFSGSVTVSCERKLAGSNGDPTFRQMLGLHPELPLDQELALIDSGTEYAWREYLEAFAA